mmetsp:Transcript_5883/g.12817  ORF Transcript_5883/g.12817 Transcript_5883/m.12817 type:complete len:213 (+) Transcript_5883:128-766(+)
MMFAQQMTVVRWNTKFREWLVTTKMSRQFSGTPKKICFSQARMMTLSRSGVTAETTGIAFTRSVATIQQSGAWQLAQTAMSLRLVRKIALSRFGAKHPRLARWQFDSRILSLCYELLPQERVHFLQFRAICIGSGRGVDNSKARRTRPFGPALQHCRDITSALSLLSVGLQVLTAASRPQAARLFVSFVALEKALRGLGACRWCRRWPTAWM